jgi:hypothetical protein
VNFRDSRAAEAVITLNDEPGMKRPAVARLRSGDGEAQFAVIFESAPKSRSTRLGS